MPQTKVVQNVFVVIERLKAHQYVSYRQIFLDYLCPSNNVKESQSWMLSVMHVD